MAWTGERNSGGEMEITSRADIGRGFAGRNSRDVGPFTSTENGSREVL